MPPAAAAFFPLDEELELGTEGLDPWLTESIALLGTVMPFGRVPLVVERLARVRVKPETARRVTEAVGRAQVGRETVDAEWVRATLPMPSQGPAVQQLSLDGAMVPLIGGEWAEVKTLALGEVTTAAAADGTATTQTTALSYFSRLSDADTFREHARGELHRRGVAAGVVCAVQDGAEWQQRFVDHHRPDAIRILDFPHAVEHLATVGRAVFGAGTPTLQAWLGTQAHAFKHGDPATVLAAVRALDVVHAVDAQAATLQAEALGYFEKRRSQLTYATFQAQGYPIGSGAVESANKLVVEARLKGSGMHWQRTSVSPMVSLRALLCSDRWTTDWPALWRARLAASPRQRPRAGTTAAPTTPLPPPAPPEPVPTSPTTPSSPQPPPLVVDGRPTKAHPWSKPFLRSRQRNPLPATT